MNWYARKESASNPYRDGRDGRGPRWLPWYESIADFMLARPGATNEEIAKHLGRATGTISYIKNTDAFRAYYSSRREQYNDHLRETLGRKLHKVAEASLDAISERLEKKRDMVPIGQLTALSTATLEALGYGPKASAAAPVQVNVSNTTNQLAVDRDALERARAAVRQSEQSRAKPALERARENLLFDNSGGIEDAVIIPAGTPDDG